MTNAPQVRVAASRTKQKSSDHTTRCAMISTAPAGCRSGKYSGQDAPQDIGADARREAEPVQRCGRRAGGGGGVGHGTSLRSPVDGAPMACGCSSRLTGVQMLARKEGQPHRRSYTGPSTVLHGAAGRAGRRTRREHHPQGSPDRKAPASREHPDSASGRRRRRPGRHLRRRHPDRRPTSTVSIDLFERLPAPFGLIRYGVAPDHPRIKEIIVALHKVLRAAGHPAARQRRLRHRPQAGRPARSSTTP